MPFRSASWGITNAVVSSIPRVDYDIRPVAARSNAELSTAYNAAPTANPGQTPGLLRSKKHPPIPNRHSRNSVGFDNPWVPSSNAAPYRSAEGRRIQDAKPRSPNAINPKPSAPRQVDARFAPREASSFGATNIRRVYKRMDRGPLERLAREVQAKQRAASPLGRRHQSAFDHSA